MINKLKPGKIVKLIQKMLHADKTTHKTDFKLDE